MRILSIGNFTIGWDGSICDEEHIAKSLEELGHEVKRCQRETISTKDSLIWSSSWNPEFVLIQQWDHYPDNLIPMLKDIYHRCPIVYWAFDYQADGQEWHERLVQGPDLYLSKRLADSKYSNWQWLPADFAPQFLDKDHAFEQRLQFGQAEKDIDILFTGSYVPWESARERIDTLKAIDDKFNLTIHSVTPNEWKAQGFKNVYGPVMDHDLPALVARAKVNLSIDNIIEAGFWSDRVAQILCCGGFVLHRYQPMCEVAFKNHVQYFYSIDDCLEKVDRMLHSYPLDYLAEAYYFAQSSLKVNHRVQDLLAIVRNIL